MAKWTIEHPEEKEIRDRAITLVRDGKRGKQKIDIRIYELPMLIDALMNVTKDIVCQICEEHESCEKEKSLAASAKEDGNLN